MDEQCGLGLASTFEIFSSWAQPNLVIVIYILQKEFNNFAIFN